MTIISEKTVTRMARADLAFSQLVREIESGVTSGSLKVGDRLPSEVELKGKYGISINSIRRGMDLLVRQGVLSRRRGSGTYVCGALPARHMVVADTILIATGIQNVPSHPFFGERHRAMIARFAGLGFKTESVVPITSFNGQENAVWHTVDMPGLSHRLETDHRIAGVVFDRMTVEQGAKTTQGRVPCVALGETEACPFVDYPLEEERSRAIQLAASTGARHIRLFCGFANGNPPFPPVETVGASTVHCTFVPMFPATRIMHAAYDAAITEFKAQLSGIDAMVMGDDVIAQGVLDALAEFPPAETERLFMVALINKESRLRTALPFSAFIADGAAAGTATADLLHQLIREPDHAPESLYLRCAIRLAKGWPRKLRLREAQV